MRRLLRALSHEQSGQDGAPPRGAEAGRSAAPPVPTGGGASDQAWRQRRAGWGGSSGDGCRGGNDGDAGGVAAADAGGREAIRPRGGHVLRLPVAEDGRGRVDGLGFRDRRFKNPDERACRPQRGLRAGAAARAPGAVRGPRGLHRAAMRPRAGGGRGPGLLGGASTP